MSRSAITLERQLRVTDAEREETLATIRKTYLDNVGHGKQAHRALVPGNEEYNVVASENEGAS